MRRTIHIQPGVLIVALDERSNEIYLVNVQRKINDTLAEMLELPGGGIEHSETPLAAAQRELKEETGVEASPTGEWVQLYDNDGVDPIDAHITTQQHAYLLLSAQQTSQPEGTETVQVVTLPLATLLEMDRQNKFADPLTPYALRRADDWLAIHRPELRT